MKSLSELIKKYKPTNDLPKLGKHFKLQYDLNILYGVLNQNTILHAARADWTNADDDAVLFPAQEESTLVIIDEFFDIVAKAPPKIYPMSHQFCVVKEISDKKPVSVKNMIEGHLVTVSKYKQTHLISTTKDVHAYNKLVDGGVISVRTAILDLLERANPYKGIDALFKDRYNLSAKDLCFTFVLSPSNGEYTDVVSDYELYIVGMYNKKTDKFYPSWQTSSFMHGFSIADDYAIKIQHPVIAYNYAHVKSIAQVRAKYPNVKGIIVNYTGENEKAAYYIPPTDMVSKQKKGPGINYEKFIGPIARPFLENNYIGGMQVRYKYEELSCLVQRYLDGNKSEINSLFQQYRYSRTAKAFYLRVGHHPFRKMLMSMYRGDIKSTHEMSRVIHLAKFTREMLKDPVYSNEIKELIKEEVNGTNKRS